MNSSQSVTCTNCGTMVDSKAKKCPLCGNKFTQVQKMVPTKFDRIQPQPDLETTFVDDKPYAGAPAFFKIKRKKRGGKWEIKDENKKKVLEAKNVLSGFRQLRKNIQLAKDMKAGKVVKTTIYTLRDAKKSDIGEISVEVTPNFGSVMLGVGSFRIKDSSGNDMVSLQIRQEATRHYYNKEPANPEDYQIETRSDSFRLDLTQGITGRVQKRNLISNIDIIDSRNEKCLSLFQKKENEFEATLFQSMSPLVANSLIVLLAQAMWPPKPQSQH